MDIFIREVVNRGVYDARLGDGTLLARSTHTPLLTAARSLLALGYSGDLALNMWRAEAAAPAISTTVGAAASLQIGAYRGKPIFEKLHHSRAVKVAE